MRKTMTLGLLLALLCGCIKNKDELTLNTDGSGKVRIETQTSFPPDLAAGMGMQGRMDGPGGILYPPTSEAEAQKYFPGKDFTISVKQQRADNGEVTTVTEVEFKDLNALLASPYGRAHQLTMKIADGALTVRGVSGMEAVARFAEMKDDTGMGMMGLPGLADAQKKKGEMRSEFRVTLPNAVSSANGERAGKSAAWIVERAKCKDADDFARQVGAVCEARCPADGLKMSPAAPLRMGLMPFAELAQGATDTGTVVDTNKVAAAAKFIPYGLSVTRSLDLSGEGGGQESAASLTGAVMVPREFSPQKWGELKLDEAVDAKGNNLKASEGDEDRSFMMRSNFAQRESDENGEDATNGVQRHVVSVNFRPPDWKVNEIARIKGSVSLQYFGGSQVVKLTNAIPAGWITDPAKMQGGSFDSSEKTLNSEVLAGLGMTLSVQTAMNQGGMTMLMLQAKGPASVTDAQVFDASGRPWPTFLMQQDSGGEGESCQVIVAGAPTPPLSLALKTTAGGTAVEVPVLVEHVKLAK